MDHNKTETSSSCCSLDWYLKCIFGWALKVKCAEEEQCEDSLALLEVEFIKKNPLCVHRVH